MLCIARLVLVHAAAVTGLQLPGLRVGSVPLRTRVRALQAEQADEVGEWGLDGLFGLMEESEEAVKPACWMIECKQLSAGATDALATTISQAQKQGNWLRGLEGRVLIEDADTVKILAAGPQDRLDSFSDWCKSDLSGANVDIAVQSSIDGNPEYCALLPLTKQFGLAGSGPEFEAWQARIVPKQKEEVAGWSEEAQF